MGPPSSNRAASTARWSPTLLILRQVCLCTGQCAFLLGVLGVGLVGSAAAQRPKGLPTDQPASSGPVDYRSRHFFLHTDLTAKEAQDLLGKLETMLALISKYWGRPPSGTIECYVVEDLSRWSPGVIPPVGLAKIRGEAGVCVTETLSRGKRFFAKSTVYAAAKLGVAQHEAVHAYCGQTFGNTGPTWYAEGMAEMGKYWRAGEKAVRAYPYVIRYLKESPPKPLLELVASEQHSGDWQDYAWRWALCHLLANNPNYAPRFRPLGLGLLLGQDVSFEQVYGPMARELSFEYLFFLRHLEQGYRVDLCAWDWKKKFRPLRTPSRSVGTRVIAARGWQPSGLTVLPAVQYECTATGTWKTAEDTPAVSADGAEDGSGQLVGMVMKDYELGEAFSLGVSTSFRPDSGGDLYLRCRDQWNELTDNSGQVSVKLRVKRKGASSP